jgi:DNA polymerase III subunit epsilon
MREVVLDTETTGLDPAAGHRIVEIGAVELMNQAPTGRTYHVLINPERDVPEEAARVHGHTAAILQDKPVFSAIADEFLTFVGDAQIVIHNAEFDVRFLNAELARLVRTPIDFSRVVDTLALARKRHPGQPNNLDALCDRYRIDRSRRVRHGALLDAEILVEVYCELTGGRQKSLSLDDAFGVAGTVIAVTAVLAEGRPARAPLIRSEETTAHAAHVKTLGESAIWLRFGLVPAG